MEIITPPTSWLLEARKRIMKKYFFGVSAVAVCIGAITFSSMTQAAVRKGSGFERAVDSEWQRGEAPPISSQDYVRSGSFSGVPSTAGNTGFEQPEWCPGFLCGPEFSGCNVRLSGNLADNCGWRNTDPNGFWMSGSSRSCTEPHIDTASPFSGTQHLRYKQALDLKSDFSAIPCGSTAGGTCRLSLFSPVECADPVTCINQHPDAPTLPGGDCCTTFIPLGPTTITAQVAKALRFNHEMAFSTQAPNTSGFLGTELTFDPENGTLIYYSSKGRVDSGVYYATGGTATTGGLYKEVKMVIDTCNFEYVYWYDGAIIGTGPVGPGLPLSIEQYVILTTNDIGPIDFDDIEVIRDASTFPCPATCGNDVRELGEVCDGTDRDFCGGLCIAAGETGECTCDCRPQGDFNCDGGLTELDNGANGPYITHGGWFVYDADTPAFGVNTCDTEGTDTWLLAWSLGPFGLGFEGFLDDCQTVPVQRSPDFLPWYSTVVDPLASCFDRHAPFCLCEDGSETCILWDEPCPGGDGDCISAFLCFGGGNEGAGCTSGDDSGCQGYCVGGINEGIDCSADATVCPASACVSGPRSSLTCFDSDDCDADVCVGCDDTGALCNPASTTDCGGNAAVDCQFRTGDCAIDGECDPISSGGAGKCKADALCGGAIDEPFESCMCISWSYYFGMLVDPSFYSTAKGTSWVFSLDYFGALPVGSSVMMNIDKRSDCVTPITLGICCDVKNGTCSGGHVDGTACSGLEVFIPNKFCNDSACPPRVGACCDRILGSCTDDVLENLCTNDQPVWTFDKTCVELVGTSGECIAVGGACCDSGNGLPGAATCSSTTFSACQCSTCTWTKGGDCTALRSSGACLVDPIPTVSEWGLVILTLLLLTGAKIYFGRRKVATA